MIVDLFSHKIHSSNEEWPDKVVELAALFAEFDGEVYDRVRIESKLRSISPRAAYAPRDPSKFRDEISAYPAYLGLYRLSPSKEGWRIFITETTKTFLLREEPDVGAFMRLQLSLFQYPSGMGAAYIEHTNNLRVQANARDRTIDMVSKGVHLSPMRLIVSALLVDSDLRSVPFCEAVLSYQEIFVLANHASVNNSARPNKTAVKNVLLKYRNGDISAPKKFESRFHILKHTELFEVGHQRLRFRKPVNSDDEADLQNKIIAINNVDNQFLGFDSASNGARLEAAIASGAWGKYFDGVVTLSGDIINALSADVILTRAIPSSVEVPEKAVIPKVYALTERREYATSKEISGRQGELADPETTKIKRQKRNLAHKLLIDKMVDYLSKLNAAPMDNPHIDLYARIPNDGSFLFEMKSGGENILDQIRKGLSQLYEYRFRYNGIIENETTLCLVVPNKSLGIPWLYEYLCVDRQICICWFNDNNELEYPIHCKERMEVLTVI